MHGKTTLWNPGCDHAGIATQVGNPFQIFHRYILQLLINFLAIYKSNQVYFSILAKLD